MCLRCSENCKSVYFSMLCRIISLYEWRSLDMAWYQTLYTEFSDCDAANICLKVSHRRLIWCFYSIL
jgi:hypothetical protein